VTDEECQKNKRGTKNTKKRAGRVTHAKLAIFGGRKTTGSANSAALACWFGGERAKRKAVARTYHRGKKNFCPGRQLRLKEKGDPSWELWTRYICTRSEAALQYHRSIEDKRRAAKVSYGVYAWGAGWGINRGKLRGQYRGRSSKRGRRGLSGESPYSRGTNPTGKNGATFHKRVFNWQVVKDRRQR